ncbi:MAG TPA: 3-hydroxyacyl-CoA dehydrogenase NAD-binding domain-containing protein, partial [Solirubrobacteraceae bacterium]
MSTSLIAIAGAGFMGTGIAESLAAAGKWVLLYEPGQAALDRARGNLAASIARAAERGKLGGWTEAELLDRVMFTTGLDDLASADAVIEAVTEDLTVKSELFARLDETVPDARFLASNTSSIPIAELAAATSRPERVLGLHFFSPVPVMKLVEVVVALDTADDALE